MTDKLQSINSSQFIFYCYQSRRKQSFKQPIKTTFAEFMTGLFEIDNFYIHTGRKASDSAHMNVCVCLKWKVSCIVMRCTDELWAKHMKTLQSVYEMHEIILIFFYVLPINVMINKCSMQMSSDYVRSGTMTPRIWKQLIGWGLARAAVLKFPKWTWDNEPGLLQRAIIHFIWVDSLFPDSTCSRIQHNASWSVHIKHISQVQGWIKISNSEFEKILLSQMYTALLKDSSYNTGK